MTNSPLSDPHATLTKFGYPGTLLHQGRHWALLVRPAQPTLGSLVLCATSDVRAYGELSADAYAEQGLFVRRIEAMLRTFCSPQKYNYLMLMMVDPHVHFHVIPRYEGGREFDGKTYTDSGWPGLPDLAASTASDQALIGALRRCWADQE